MSWLEDYHDGLPSDYRHPKCLPVDADLHAWEAYVEEGLDELTHGLSFLGPTQEDADIGEEILDA